jgi:hypothetical protein
MIAIAYRTADDHVVCVVSVDGIHRWTSTAAARRDGYEVLYR